MMSVGGNDKLVGETDKMAQSKSIDVGILFYTGAQSSAVHGLTDLLQFANDISSRRCDDAGSASRFNVSHWSLGEDRVQPEQGVSDGSLDVLLLPPSRDTQEMRPSPPALRDWITEHHKSGCLICSVCAGAFVLAETGLIDGRRITTHWALRDRFEQAHPQVRTDTDKLIVDDGDIVTAGGMMAWVDLGLLIVRRFIGATVMQELAKLLLVDPAGREQIFYNTFTPRLRHGDGPILKVQHWLQENFASRISVATLRQIAGLEERTFLRRFTKATGHAPMTYLQMLRVGKARELLEHSALPAEQIAWRVGYSDKSAFHTVFRRISGLTPGEYRRRFNYQVSDDQTV